MKPITIGQVITDRQDASLSMYFKDVSKQPMIDINEEIALSRRIKQGDKEALDKLVCANLRFVISVAKQYQGKGLPLVDLIQSGNEGLIESAKLYDADKGFKFISYAVWWIRQSIIRSLSDQCRTVRVQVNQLYNINKINNISDKFESIHERKPSITELEKETNFSYDKIISVLNSATKSVSLDTPFGDDEDCGCLIDVIPNSNSIDSDSQITDEYVSDEIEKVLNKLSYRERDVLRMSFGLKMLPMTLEEIATRFGVGAERIRQIQNEAIAKIKMNYSHLLKNLL